MPDDSTKHENFRRLAEARTQAVLEALRKLSNLSSPNYEYEEDEVDRVFAAVQRAVDEGRERFRPRSRAARFSL